MKIEPGVYALHRAAQTEVSATEFRDDDRGLTVSVGTPADTADKKEKRRKDPAIPPARKKTL